MALLEDRDVMKDCARCDQATLHRDGRCRRCAAINEIGSLRAKAAKPFDLARMLSMALVLGLFAAFIWLLIARS